MSFMFQRVKTAKNTALFILGNWPAFINIAVQTAETNGDTR